jgi:archaellum component FlaC
MEIKYNFLVAASQTSQLSDATSQLENVTSQLSDATSQLENVTSQLSDATSQLEKVEATKKQLQTERDDLNDNLVKTNKELELQFKSTGEVETALSDSCKELRLKNTKLQGDVKELRGANTKLQGSYSGATDESKKLQGQRTKLEGETEKLQGENEKLRVDVTKLQGENSTLKIENSTVKNLENTIQGQRKELLESKAKSNIEKNLIKEIATSSWFTYLFLTVTMSATFGFAIREMIGGDILGMVSHWTEYIPRILTALVLAVAMIWIAFSDIPKNHKIIAMIFYGACEWVSFSNALGLPELIRNAEGLEWFGVVGIVIFSGLLPFTTYQLAHIQNDIIKKFELNEIMMKTETLFLRYDIKDTLQFKNDLTELLVN